MGKTKQPWHRGTYQQRSAKVRAAAYAQPATRCWRCRCTLAEIRTIGRGDGKPKPRAKWTAGHVIDSQVDGNLQPECSPCNFGAGAAMGNQRRRPTKRTSLRW